MIETLQQTPRESALSPLTLYLREHGLPQLQHVDISVLAGEHTRPHNVSFIQNTLEREPRPDIFLTELPGHTAEMHARMNALTPFDTLRPEPFYANQFIDQMVRAVRRRNIPIGLIDIGKGHAQDRRLQKAAHTLQNIATAVRPLSYRKALDAFATAARDFGTINRTREHVMREAIGTEIAHAVAAGSIPADSKKLDVQIFVGAAHTGLFHGLKRHDEHAQLVLQESPTIFLYTQELLRYYTLNKKVPEALVAKAYTEALVIDILNAMRLVSRRTSNTEESRFMRELADAITPQEAAQLHHKMKQAHGNQAALAVALSSCKDFLLEKIQSMPDRGEIAVRKR